VLNNPIKFSKTKAEITMAGPKLGEHSEDILKGLGYTEGEIQAMKGYFPSKCGIDTNPETFPPVVHSRVKDRFPWKI
jgi:hypothetical protein